MNSILKTSLAEAANRAAEPPLVTCRPDASALKDALERNPGADIAIVADGVKLPFAWEARLRKAAYAAPNIAAAVPMSDAAPMFTLASGEARSDPVRIDRLAYVLGTRSYYEVPRIHGVCAYLRRDALDRSLDAIASDAKDSTAFLDTLVKRWRALGLSCVMCDYIYVGAGAASRGTQDSGDLESRAFIQHHPLAGLRRAVSDALKRGLSPTGLPGLEAKPVQLHIMHFWGGGLDRWVRDFGRADAARINMILASYRIGEDGGQRLVLYSDPTAMIPVRTWDIARPIRSTAPSSVEYRRILEQVVEEFGVEAIVVSSLIGHALDALALPVKTIVVCHDFYPVCQAINPYFGKTCERCTLEDLGRCARSNPLNRVFVGESSEDWHAMRTLYADRIVENGIEIVVPTRSVAKTLGDIDPRLKPVTKHVIPHGIDFDVPKVKPAARAEKLRIVVLGRLSSLQKGTQLLQEACDGLKPFADVTLVGCGANGMKLASRCGWQAIENYKLEELPELLERLQPDLGLLASTVPETFSYTLSELEALGIPPVATAIGAFAERVREAESGFLFEPRPQALVDLVQRLHADRGAIERVARHLATQPRGRTVGEMVRDYDALLPTGERRVARFRVGIGEQSALTEPYRHLSEAYTEVSQAYAQLSVAYGQVDGAYAQAHRAYVQSNEAYEQAKSAYEATRAMVEQRSRSLQQWNDEFAALNLSKRWWRVRKAARLAEELKVRVEGPSRGAATQPAAQDAASSARYPWAESLFPRLLKSPWWIGHIPFAFELIARLRPRVIVELGTYSGSSFAAFCQALEACQIDGKCYGVDLWEGDVHMGHFEDSLFREISDYVAANHPSTAVLVRKDFNAAVHDFADGSIDLLHIDGTHTYEAVSNDFNTWLPKMSPRGVVLFHDVNVNMENTGPASLKFGVRTFFDGVKSRYPHLEFEHCWGLGVLVVGSEAAPAVMELVTSAKTPGFREFFAAKGALVSKRFEDLGIPVAMHEPYVPVPVAPLWRRVARRIRGLLPAKGT